MAVVVKQDAITRIDTEIACMENGYGNPCTESGEVLQYLRPKKGEKVRGEGSSEWEEERERGRGLKKGGRRSKRLQRRSGSLFRRERGWRSHN